MTQSHTALSHLDKSNTYVRMLFIDYSSAFNTIVPSKLITKLRTLGLNTSLCNWIRDFLTGCPQVVRASCLLMLLLLPSCVWPAWANLASDYWPSAAPGATLRTDSSLTPA
ncbi:uncharacterized protein ACWYII_036358 isoform 1-T3 [Salvelinus alpinus]